ncbi:adaptor-related protein complex 3, sigma 2 subunit [Toxoplasma gondii TgCatPRC2]|uniref:AP complex subunit sigma n=13 Tax=Toxoplasma gondii TaxID=5811 RepID=B9PZP9_TOXGV|nr:adaptor-related protein complex 3, sigma 2 subunit [Toxoplasma gondii GT1]ESS31169.1 adaptor-related protein complex 3, sigma 2 subunit [Toxoplasma gondii VEG]KAF4640025.1 adaptor-related protein complex 3, sigma 2 subunit [Toxoplasma gondii]KFG41416.1 adaptor-related protein complex 3, sigma 2 subunit [Toxoplasma gondii p89]KFG52870.1 adaptor-related protein complex 3, sigma 2 subunit [Toxoplasma gondii FOU]KFG62184.1 adaptor-related protein complex 3, sigma 2 subunit [Toxoplasma gondii RU
MIKAVIVVNNHGKPRLLRFYDGTPHEKQQHILRRTYQVVSQRPGDSSCCFAEDKELFGPETKIVYRHFATLYFIFITDEMESELGVLDLIQVFVQVLDSCFENVCELDLIYHFDKANFILDEIIVGGLVIETNVDNILQSISSVKKLVDSEASLFAAA